MSTFCVYVETLFQFKKEIYAVIGLFDLINSCFLNFLYNFVIIQRTIDGIQQIDHIKLSRSGGHGPASKYCFLGRHKEIMIPIRFREFSPEEVTATTGVPFFCKIPAI